VAAVQTKIDQMQGDTKKQADAVQEQVDAVQTKMDERMDQLQATLQAILAASQMPDAERSAAEEVRRVEKAEAERLVLETAETRPEPEPEPETKTDDEEEPEPVQ
jgi:tRNA U34 5-carboxymethylaminomethyl modifying GTPase MnmE/TrmE